MQRRSILKLSGIAGVTSAALPWLFQRRVDGTASSGRLQKDPARVLDLSPGLRYRILERAYDRMSDGHWVPARPDGMACFQGRDANWVLMRNHELEYNLALGPYRADPVAQAYDPAAAGCVTRLIVSPETRERVSSNLVLAGTHRNCAGGMSPWGWISCEESTDDRHGYAFLCPIDQERVAAPQRLTGYGRYRHEAACVDPATLIAYLTEDQPDGCVYRFVPHHPSRPFVGKLQALKHPAVDNYSLSDELRPGDGIEVDWVDIADPDPKADTVRYQAAGRGAARLRRGEGIWLSQSSVFICSTTGGRAQLGQIFALELGRGALPDRLRLIAESPDASTLDMPDNITVAPWGDIVVAEDGWGEQYLRGITPQGSVYDIGRNAASRGEFAGVCFSPDGSTLFANLQLDGLTVAISGTFPRLS